VAWSEMQPHYLQCFAVVPNSMAPCLINVYDFFHGL
jgi:hypothetical protein